MARIFLVWLVLASCIGWGVYQLKYEVQHLEDRLARVNREILNDQESIQILKAEWSYLNQPARLADMAKRFLALEPVEPRQMVTLDELPQRREPSAIADARPMPTPTSMPTAAPSAARVPSAAANAKPTALPADLDDEATHGSADATDEPPVAPDTSLLLVKGVPQ